MMYYTVSQVAALLGVSTDTVRRREAEGKLPPARRMGLRADRQWAKDELDAYLERTRPSPVRGGV